MDLVLVVGNLFLSERSSDVPEEIKSILTMKKFNHVICTGNICNKEGYNWLSSLGTKFTCLSDVLDEINLLNKEVVKISDFRIGIVNNTIPNDIQSFSSLIKELNTDILIHGSTCIPSFLNFEGKYIICPGSLTGAYSKLNYDSNPSFVVLAIQGDFCIAYLYEMNKKTKNVDCSKVEFNKA